jgi:hypothetical protein
MTQTAVEWLFMTLSLTPMTDWYNVLEQAKAIEIEHLEDCWIAAEQSEDSQTFFNYYNETYNK